MYNIFHQIILQNNNNLPSYYETINNNGFACFYLNINSNHIIDTIYLYKNNILTSIILTSNHDIIVYKNNIQQDISYMGNQIKIVHFRLNFVDTVDLTPGNVITDSRYNYIKSNSILNYNNDYYKYCIVITKDTEKKLCIIRLNNYNQICSVYKSN